MDDMAEKITALLNDPNGMEKIKSVASALFRDSEPASNQNSSSGELSLPEGIDMEKIMGIASALSCSGSDERAVLLTALKPHLSPDRRTKVDRAIKLLKIVSVLPVLKQQGLLDLI